MRYPPLVHYILANWISVFDSLPATVMIRDWCCHLATGVRRGGSKPSHVPLNFPCSSFLIYSHRNRLLLGDLPLKSGRIGHQLPTWFKVGSKCLISPPPLQIENIGPNIKLRKDNIRFAWRGSIRSVYLCRNFWYWTSRVYTTDNEPPVSERCSRRRRNWRRYRASSGRSPFFFFFVLCSCIVSPPHDRTDRFRLTRCRDKSRVQLKKKK